MTILLVAVGGLAGTVLRYLAGHHLDGSWPRGTLLVNTLGSFLLGLFFGLDLGDDAMALLGTGFCGGFTTYSALSVRSVELGPRRGSAYAVGTVVLAVTAAAAGFALAR